MQVVKEEFVEKLSIPRFTKQFIGISHELEKKRRDRRQIELEERSMANRVLFLEKSEIKTQKTLIKKKELFSKMIETIDRQTQEQNEKDRIRMLRDQQLERIRNENLMKRLIHKDNKTHAEEEVLHRNSFDYSRIKKIVTDGEKRKMVERNDDMREKREKYVTLNLRKDSGRDKIDKYFRRKNKEHTQTYQNMIRNEENKSNLKAQTIKQLETIETVLRKRLEESSLKVTQVDRMIGHLSKSIVQSHSRSRMSLKSSRNHINGSKMSRKQSKQNISKKNVQNEEDSDIGFLLTNIEAELVDQKKIKSQTTNHYTSNNKSSEDLVEEQIGVNQEVQSTNNLIVNIKKRRKNKHKNRYQEYQLF